MSVRVGGSVEAGWERVRDAFAANLDSGQETGCAVSVYHRGRKVVDLWGGHFDKERSTAYTDDTLQLVFSTTKGITAIAVAICVQRGLLSYSEKVSTYWPEFAQLGKDFCAWDRSGEDGACGKADLNRSAFVAWIDCRL